MKAPSGRSILASTVAIITILLAVLNHFSNLQTVEQLLPAPVREYGYIITIAGFVFALMLLKSDAEARTQPRLKIEYDPTATQNPHGDFELHRLAIKNLQPATVVDDVTVSIVGSSQEHLTGFMPYKLRRQVGEPVPFSAFGDTPVYVELLQYRYGGDPQISTEGIERDMICCFQTQRGAFMHEGEYTFDVQAVGRNVAAVTARFRAKCVPSQRDQSGALSVPGKLIITSESA